MSATAIDFRPGPYSDFGPVTLSNGSAASPYWLTVGSDGHLYENGARFNIVADHFIETACGLDTDAEVAGICKHSAAYGINAVRFLGWNNKAVSSALVNGGCWTDPSGTGANNGAVVYGAGYNEAFLVQMDKTIANLTGRNIRIWFAFDHGDKARIVGGLPPNTANGSTSNKASNGDHGMMWSSEWMDCYEAHQSYILSRPSTVTGIALKDNPMVSVIQGFNENTFWDACTKVLNDAVNTSYTGVDFIVAEVGGTGSGPSGGSGYWRTPLDTHWNAHAAANGFTWPVSRFPLFATWNAWPNTDKERMIDYIKSVDRAGAIRNKAFIKALSPSCLYCYGETRYTDMRVADVSDVQSIHVYENEGGGSTAGTPTRKSAVDNANGIEWSYWSQRLVGRPMVRTEGPGQYTRNRNDFDSEVVAASVICLQDGDGLTQFCAWQNSFYSTAAGSAQLHYTSVWPSRRLAYLFAAPIVKHRLIQPLASAIEYQLDPAQQAALIRAGGQVCQTGERISGVSSEYSWMRKRLYSKFGTPQDVSTDSTWNDAAIQAGVTVAAANGNFFLRGAGGANPNVAWDFPGVAGEAISVNNFSRGGLTIAGLAGPTRLLAAARSSGPWPLGAGESVLFLHGASFQTDMTVSGGSTYPANLDAFLAGDVLTISGGTDANTRLFTPDPVTVSLAWGVNHQVYGLSCSGLSDTVSGVLVPSTFNAATGVVSFTSDRNYPAYRLVPVSASSAVVSTGKKWGHQRGGVR